MSSFAGVPFVQVVDGRRWAGKDVDPDGGPTRYRVTARVTGNDDLAALEDEIAVVTFRRPLGMRTYSWVSQNGVAPSALIVPKAGTGSGALVTFANAFLLAMNEKGVVNGTTRIYEVDFDFALPEVA